MIYKNYLEFKKMIKIQF